MVSSDSLKSAESVGCDDADSGVEDEAATDADVDEDGGDGEDCDRRCGDETARIGGMVDGRPTEDKADEDEDDEEEKDEDEADEAGSIRGEMGTDRILSGVPFTDPGEAIGW